MRWASFRLKYYQSNLHAECLSGRIRLSLAGEGQILTCSSQVRNICCCSQGKIPEEPKQPSGIRQSVCPGVCCSDLLLDDGGGDILPSGSHCSGLAVTADVWLRTEVKMAVRVWEGSEVSLCCWCPGRFSTLSRRWQHRTSPACSSRVQEDSSFQDTGGHACSSLEVISLFSPSQCIIRWQGRPGLCAPRRDGWSSVFHSGHGDWLLLINPLNDFKGKLICPQSPEDTAVSRSPVAKIETKPLCPFRYIWPLTP